MDRSCLPAHPVHAGLLETSRVVAARPDLVPSSVATAPSIAARDIPELYRIAAGAYWPGYFGAPRYATPDIGRRVFEGDTEWIVTIASRFLDGEADERTIARVAARCDFPSRTGVPQERTPSLDY